MHVGETQQKTAQFAGLVAITNNDAGQNRNQRIHAGGECQPYSRQIEEADDRREAFGAKGIVSISADHLLCNRSVDRREFERLGLRWITQPCVGAALRGGLERHRPFGCCTQRQLDAQFAMVDLDLAEIGVLLDLARRETGLAQLQPVAFQLKAEALPIQVIAIGNLITQLDGLRISHARTGNKCLVGWQEIGSLTGWQHTQPAQQQAQQAIKSEVRH